VPSAGVERCIGGESGAYSENPECRAGGSGSKFQGFGSGTEKGGEGGVSDLPDRIATAGKSSVSPPLPPFFQVKFRFGQVVDGEIFYLPIGLSSFSSSFSSFLPTHLEEQEGILQSSSCSLLPNPGP
jgi:hypothetical protein